MNLRQLRYISTVARNGLNVSAAAESLYTSQPGVSKQIRQLEDELGVPIFERSGRQLTRVTAAGAAVIERAERALIEIETIRQAATEHSDPERGNLAIAGSHTQSRFALPPVIARFRERYPRVTVSLHQGAPHQIAELALEGRVDFAIATEAFEHFEDLVMLPCYHWYRCLLVPRGHPLAEAGEVTFDMLAEQPIVTYVFGFTGRSQLDAAFEERGVKPNVVLTATDATTIKRYVRLGLGVGIVARMAWEADRDADLVPLDASALFPPSTTKVGFRRGIYLRGYMYDFLGLFAPHLTREVLDTAQQLGGKGALDALFVDADLPVY